MKKEILSKNGFESASDFLLHSARALERKIYESRFQDSSSNKVVMELQHYQNPDGGFGHGLGPDLRSPVSSPIVTTKAFQILSQIEREGAPEELVKNAIRYFERSFDEQAERWFTVPPEINNYPHAPWWHYDGENGGTVLDESWGNPTAEIIGYLLEYKDLVNGLSPTDLLPEAVDRLDSKEDFCSEHEIYCYVRLFRRAPEDSSTRMWPNLAEAVQGLIQANLEEWGNYVPKPLDFVKEPDHESFGIDRDLLEKNLNFLVENLEENGVIEPAWEWGQYEEEWDRAKKEWTGILTLEGLITLDQFNRIDI